jgi:hypothetical protein
VLLALAVAFLNKKLKKEAALMLSRRHGRYVAQI